MPNCDVCSTESEDTENWYVDNTYRELCLGCQDSTWCCANCDESYLNRVSAYCDRCDVYTCDYCADEYHNHSNHRLKEWDYRPYFTFFGQPDQVADDRPPPTYLGLELELECDIDRGLDVIEDYDDLLYAKEDGSIGNGFEIVSHPMTLAWAQKNFPLDVLDRMKNEAEASTHDGVGVHVHVSRDTFTDRQHRFRWAAFFYRHPNQIQQLARRGSTGYCSWPWSYDPVDVADQVHGQYGERYAPINPQNSATLELRIFKATLQPTVLMSYLELAAASVEFTRQVDLETTPDGLDWTHFETWLLENATTYPNLLERMPSETRPSRFAGLPLQHQENERALGSNYQPREAEPTPEPEPTRNTSDFLTLLAGAVNRLDEENEWQPVVGCSCQWCQSEAYSLDFA